MIPCPLNLWLGIGAGAAAVFITSVRLILADLSLGSVRKLEESDPELAKLFAGWLRRRDEYRITLRVLLIGDAAIIFLCAASRVSQGLAAPRPAAVTMWPLLAGALIYFLLTEWLAYDLPKTAGRALLRFAMPLVKTASLLLAPLAWPLARWHQAVLRHRRHAAPEDETTTTEDEIMSLVETDELRDDAPADLEEDERRMIRGIFDLDETLVKEIMTPRVDLDAIAADAGAAEIKNLIVSSGHSRIPVYHDSIDHIIGLVLAKDLLDDERMSRPEPLTKMLHPVLFIPETKNIGDLLAEFQQNLAHFAVVVDEYGGTAGIVTLEDILEEIVGEIQDEYDREEQEIAPQVQADGSVIVDARTSIYELNEQLGLNLPENEDFDTLGGYVSFTLGRIPDAGELIANNDFNLQILEADRRRILKARLIRKPPGEQNRGSAKGTSES